MLHSQRVSQVTEGLRELGLFGLQIPEEYGGLVRGSATSGLPCRLAPLLLGPTSPCAGALKHGLRAHRRGDRHVWQGQGSATARGMPVALGIHRIPSPCPHLFLSPCPHLFPGTPLSQ